MDETTESHEVRPNFGRRFARAFKFWMRSGFGPLSSLGVIGGFFRNPAAFTWHIISDAFTAHDVFSALGGNTAMLMSVATSPFFSIALICAGFIGIPAAKAANENDKPTEAWLIAGWGTFLIAAAVLMASYLVNDYMDSSGQAALRQYYYDQHAERHLPSDIQTRLLKSKKVNSVPLHNSQIYIASSSDDSSEALATELYFALQAIGLAVVKSGNGSQDKGERGIMIEILDPDHPSQAALDLMQLLEDSGIHVTIERWDKGAPVSGIPDFSVFVTRPLFRN